MENRRTHSSGLSSIAGTAVISVAVLLGALVWQVSSIVAAKNASLLAVADYSQKETSSASQENLSGGSIYQAQSANTAGAADTIQDDSNNSSQIGDSAIQKLLETYDALQQTGAYTASAGERVAEGVASSIEVPVIYAPILESAIKTDPDTSYNRMLQYRGDMRVATEPLLLNTEAEFSIFAQYLETKDKSNLAKLIAVADRYRNAAANAGDVVVPKDSVSYHARIINSLLYFAATLEQLARYADDPLASLALLQTYNGAELDVYNSFNALALFQKNKKP